MYNVISKSGLTLNTCETLSDAMAFAKMVGVFVTIKGPEYEVCGMFGVDAIEHAKLPDGNSYTWTMRRDGTHRSWRKKLG